MSAWPFLLLRPFLKRNQALVITLLGCDASQSLMKPAGAFDLRPLFSPITSPPEEKVLIYVLFFFFFFFFFCNCSHGPRLF